MSRFTTSDGVGIEFTVHHGDGAGLPIILVMGFVMPGHVWRHLVPHLDPRHPTVWYDQRGSGRSDAPAHTALPYSMPRLARDAIELMDHLGWRTAHVVGVSMGGMVAQHIALDHMDRVKSLALVATHAGGFRNRFPTARGLFHFVGALTSRSADARIAALSRLLFPDDFRVHVGERYLHDVLVKDLADPPTPNGRAGQLKAVIGHDTRRRLGELGRLPTTIVRPGQDLLIKPRCSDELHAAIPGSQLVVIDEAGHGLVRQTPQIIAHALAENFARASA